MRLFSEEVTPTFTNSNLNILTVKDFYEVFFDVYELEINGKKYVTEKVSEYKGSPVVSVNIVHNNKEYSTKCVLQRGKFSLLVNEQTLKYEGESSIIDDDILIESTKEDEVEEIIFEKHESILEDIQKAKQSARDYLQKLKEQHEAQLIESQEKRAKEIKKELKAIRQDLVEEFIQIASNTQQEISESNDALKKGITSKVNILTKALEGHVNNKTESLQSLLEKKFNDLVLDITNGVISKKLEDGQKFVEENIKRVLQAVDDKLTTIDQVSIDLNDSIQKSSNKALSRIGNVKTKLEESITNSVTVLQHDIDKASIRIREYYDNEITKLNETVSLLGDETKKECIKLVSESRDSLLKTINEIKVEVPNIVIEKKDGTNQEIDLKKVKAELEKSITTRFSTELMSLKKMIEMMSGGGSVAQQFANGGVMNGNLTIVGAISASQYLGIPGGGGGVSGDYLPLSGGTITGSLSASGMVTSPDFSIAGVTGAEIAISKSVTTWEYGPKTISVTTQATNPTGVDFNDTGTKAFVINAAAGFLNVYQYNLITPWDLTTGSYSTIFKSVSGADSSPTGIKFSRDGLFMFIVGDTNNSIYRYTLTDPWDLNTVSVNPNETYVLTNAISGVTTLTSPQGVDFSLDGTKMYVANSFNNNIFQFDLVNPWVLTGASYSGNSLNVNVTPINETFLQDVVISSDGTRLFIIGSIGDRIWEYTLPTPYSLSGATLHGPMRVNTSGNNTLNMPPVATSAENTPTGLYYNDILNKCFFIGSNADRIQEIIVNPQILLIGERPVIQATGSALGIGAGSVRMNRLRITDTTSAGANSNGGDGALTVAGGIGAANITVAGAIIGSGLRVDNTGNITFNTRSVITSPVNGDIRFTNTAQDSFGKLHLGPTTDLFPSIVRSGTDIQLRTGGTGAVYSSMSARAVTLSGGDIEMVDSATGVILKSPDGTRYRVTVANGGTLTVTAV